MSNEMIQTIMNIGAGVMISLMGYLLKTVTNQIEDLKKGHVETLDKISSMEVLMARQYVHNDVVKVLFEKLDKIDAKLDNRMTRDDCKEFRCRDPR